MLVKFDTIAGSLVVVDLLLEALHFCPFLGSAFNGFGKRDDVAKEA